MTQINIISGIDGNNKERKKEKRLQDIKEKTVITVNLP